MFSYHMMFVSFISNTTNASSCLPFRSTWVFVGVMLLNLCSVS